MIINTKRCFILYKVILFIVFHLILIMNMQNHFTDKELKILISSNK